MGLYQFRCDERHTTLLEVKHYACPETVECGTCRAPAGEAFLMPSNYEKWSGIAWHTTRCGACGEEDLQRYDFKAGERVTDPKPCDACAAVATTAQVPKVANERSWEEDRFPYYDPGLGVTITSKAHWKQVCKAKNVVPVEGGMHFTAQAEMRRIEDEDARVESEYREMMAEYEESPDFADYRQLRDKGAFDQQHGEVTTTHQRI